MVDVAKDVAKLFDLPDSKITYVKDRAFNDQCASLSLIADAACLHCTNGHWTASAGNEVSSGCEP